MTEITSDTRKADEDISTLLKELVDRYDKEDRSVRERQILVWRELRLMYEGFRKYYYDSVAHDWRIWYNTDVNSDDTQQDAYDKPINVFRAYLDTIFAALSVVTPPVEAYPDDANNALDILTAKAATRASLLLNKQNDDALKWLHGLFVFGTEGMTAAYICKNKDKKYGTYSIDNYDNDAVEHHQSTKCSLCGHEIDSTELPQPLKDTLDKLPDEPAEELINETGDEEQDVNQPSGIDTNSDQEECPNCKQMMTPTVTQETLNIPKLINTTKEAKSQVHYEVYGGLNVKVPNYARKQSDCPYLIFYEEKNYVDTFDLFDENEYDHDELLNKLRANTGPRDYQDWSRLSPQYNGEYPRDIVTIKRAWLRPNTFKSLSKVECDKLTKKFPNGVLVTLVNDCFASAVSAALDDSWKIAYNPLANDIHFNPLGLLLVSTQELTNDIISLVMQTIEHGISQTFADPGVLNFNAYRQMETVPGAIYEATPKAGKSVGDGFFSEKTATLSGEVLPFFQQLQSLGQLASGALPSIFGGQIEGSDTASEYSMSRAQALQRLQNTWKILSTWFKDIKACAIPMFLEVVKEQGDANLVQKGADGNFFNIVIRKSELEGKIGSIELEANEQLPVTWAQKRDVITKLLESANPEVLAVLGTPENLLAIREAIGLDQFIVPGEADRNKQYDEIKQLLASEPIMDETGIEQPSVAVDPDFDDHDIEFDITRSWVISEVGQQTKIDNAVGFRNVLLHGKQHLVFVRMAQQAQAMSDANSNPEKPNGSTEINNESDVNAVA